MEWGSYERISEDPDDEQRGVSRQQQDNRAVVEQLGGELVKDYLENDTSAYKKKRVTLSDTQGNEYVGYRVIRPEWTQALHDLRTGVIKGLVVWDMDRLARDPRDLEDAIEVVEYHGAKIVSGTTSEIDLTTESGRMMARFYVIIANKASADTGRRVKRAHLENARAGVPVGGWRPFGWKEDKATLHPVESVRMQHIIGEVIEGAQLRPIAARLNDDGLRTTAGKEWKAATLRQYLRNPRLMGLRTQHGKVVHDEAGRPVRGLWEPMVDAETYDRLQAVLSKPDKRARQPRRGARHYLLTGILRCGLCNAVMYGNADKKRKTPRFDYVCRENGHVLGISGIPTDATVTELVYRRMTSNPLEHPGTGQWPGESRLTELREQIDDTMSAFREGKLSSARAFGLVEGMEREEADMQEDRAQWLAATTGPALKHIPHKEFTQMPVEELRPYVEKYLVAIYVLPATRRSGRYDPERLSSPVWRSVELPPAARQDTAEEHLQAGGESTPPTQG